jgi:hypothetical protein
MRDALLYEKVVHHGERTKFESILVLFLGSSKGYKSVAYR